jgi:hypothetical protein
MKGVKQANSLNRSAPVKVCRHMFQAHRPPVSGSIRYQDPEAFTKRFDLSVERIDLIAPSAVQKQERRTNARITIVNLNRTQARSQRRFIDV